MTRIVASSWHASIGLCTVMMEAHFMSVATLAKTIILHFHQLNLLGLHHPRLVPASPLRSHITHSGWTKTKCSPPVVSLQVRFRLQTRHSKTIQRGPLQSLNKSLHSVLEPTALHLQLPTRKASAVLKMLLSSPVERLHHLQAGRPHAQPVNPQRLLSVQGLPRLGLALKIKLWIQFSANARLHLSLLLLATVLLQMRVSLQARQETSDLHLLHPILLLAQKTPTWAVWDGAAAVQSGARILLASRHLSGVKELHALLSHRLEGAGFFIASRGVSWSGIRFALRSWLMSPSFDWMHCHHRQLRYISLQELVSCECLVIFWYPTLVHGWAGLVDWENHLQGVGCFWTKILFG